MILKYIASYGEISQMLPEAQCAIFRGLPYENENEQHHTKGRLQRSHHVLSYYDKKSFSNVAFIEKFGPAERLPCKIAAAEAQCSIFRGLP